MRTHRNTHRLYTLVWSKRPKDYPFPTTCFSGTLFCPNSPFLCVSPLNPLMVDGFINGRALPFTFYVLFAVCWYCGNRSTIVLIDFPKPCPKTLFTIVSVPFSVSCSVPFPSSIAKRVSTSGKWNKCISLERKRNSERIAAQKGFSKGACEYGRK